MLEIEFHLQAEAEMRDAASSYEERRLVWAASSQTMWNVEQTGFNNSPIPGRLTKASIDGTCCSRFPYGFIYRIAPEKIFIVAVAHLRRKP